MAAVGQYGLSNRGIPFSGARYAGMYSNTEKFIPLCEASFKSYPVIPHETLMQTWAGKKPFRLPREGEEGEFGAPPKALDLPALQEESVIPSLASLSLGIGAEELANADEEVIRQWWETMKAVEHDAHKLPGMVLRVLGMRFAEDASANSILDFSNCEVKPSDLRLLLRLFGPSAAEVVAYLDFSNATLVGGETFSVVDLEWISESFPSLRCVNLVGSELFSPEAINEFYSIPKDSPEDGFASIPRVALIYQAPSPPESSNEQFKSLLRFAPPLVSEPPRLSLVVRTLTYPGYCCQAKKTVHYNATSIPFFQLDSALEAIVNGIRCLTAATLSDSSMGSVGSVMQTALSSLGPGFNSVNPYKIFGYEDRPPAYGFVDAEGAEVEDALKDSIRIFPTTISNPSLLTGLVAIMDVGEGIWDKAKPNSPPIRPVTFGFVDLGRKAPPLTERPKADPHALSVWQAVAGEHVDDSPEEEEKFLKEEHTPFQPITLESFIDKMSISSPEAHMPNAQLLENARTIVGASKAFSDEEMTHFVAKMRNYRLPEQADYRYCQFH